MKNNIQEITQALKNFNADTINAYLTEEEKMEFQKASYDIDGLTDRIRILKEEIEEEIPNCNRPDPINFTTSKNEHYTRNFYFLDTFNSFDICKIINMFAPIKFKNNRGYLSEIISANIYNGKVGLKVKFGAFSNSKISLDNFIRLYEKGDFKFKDTDKGSFVEMYLRSQSYIKNEKIKKLESEIKIADAKLNDTYNSTTILKAIKIYNDKKSNLVDAYNSITKNLERNVPAEKAKKKRNSIESKQLKVKNIWDSVVSERDKAYMMGWFCRHINKITIKVVDGGVSDKIISTAYPDEIYGVKYKEKANSSGWDASSGTIAVDTITDAPIETIKSLSTIKHLHYTKNGIETIFNGKELSNLDLTLFLLSKYNKYGFKSGVSELRTHIDANALKLNEFADYGNDFDKGYLGNLMELDLWE